MMDRVNIAGAESGQQGNYVGKGADPKNNVWTLDGMVITDMATRGASPTYFTYDAFDQVSGGGGRQRHRPGHRRRRHQLRDQARHQRVPRRRRRLLHARRPAVLEPARRAARATRGCAGQRQGRPHASRSRTTASTSAGRSSRTSCGSTGAGARRTSASCASPRPRTRPGLVTKTGKLNWQASSQGHDLGLLVPGQQDQDRPQPGLRPPGSGLLPAWTRATSSRASRAA